MWIVLQVTQFYDEINEIKYVGCAENEETAKKLAKNLYNNQSGNIWLQYFVCEAGNLILKDE